MLEDIRPGRLVEASADAWETPGRDVRPRLEGMGPAPVAPRAGAALGARWLFLAAVLHGAVAVALALPPLEERRGGGGTDLEAISIEVAVVSATEVDSRLAEASVAQAGAATDQVAGAQADPARAEQRVEAELQLDPEPETGAARRKPDEKTLDAAAAPPATASLAVPADPTPPVSDDIVLPERRQEPVHEAPPETAHPVEIPPPDAKPEAVRASEAEQPAVEREAPRPNVAAPGSASVTQTSASAAARAANPGAVRAYTQAVVEALKRTRPKARRWGAKGEASIEFVVAESGGLEGVRVLRSSGHAVLDEAAVDAVRRARFPPPPSGMTRQQRMFRLPYTFN